jgi:hypothetical protein
MEGLVVMSLLPEPVKFSLGIERLLKRFAHW